MRDRVQSGLAPSLLAVSVPEWFPSFGTVRLDGEGRVWIARPLTVEKDARGTVSLAVERSEVRPLDYPDDVPFIANAACWIRERDDARIVIWGDEDRPGTLDVEGLGGFPLALDEVQSIVAQSGDDRAALKKSLAAMLINSRRESKNRGSLQLAGNGEARSMDDRTAAVVAQSTQDGLERRRGAFAGGSRPSCLLRRGATFRVVAPGGAGLSTMCDMGVGGE